jgi:hypothetical protein
MDSRRRFILTLALMIAGLLPVRAEAVCDVILSRLKAWLGLRESPALIEARQRERIRLERSYSEISKELQARSGMRPRFVARGEAENATQMDKVIATDASGQTKLGTMLYVLSPSLGGQHLKVDSVVSHGAKGGISKLLLAAVLHRNPSVNEIGATLVGTNDEAYWKARKTMPHLEAIKETPMYKAAAQMGFTRILSASQKNDSEGVEIILTRP